MGCGVWGLGFGDDRLRLVGGLGFRIEDSSIEQGRDYSKQVEQARVHYSEQVEQARVEYSTLNPSLPYPITTSK